MSKHVQIHQAWCALTWHLPCTYPTHALTYLTSTWNPFFFVTLVFERVHQLEIEIETSFIVSKRGSFKYLSINSHGWRGVAKIPLDPHDVSNSKFCQPYFSYLLISWKFSGFAQFCPSFPRVLGPHLIKLASLCACCCTLGQQQDPNSHGPLSVVVGAWHMEGWEKTRKKG